MYCFYFKSNHCPQVFIKILYLLSIFQSLEDVDLKVLPIKKPDIWFIGLPYLLSILSLHSMHLSELLLQSLAHQ